MSSPISEDQYLQQLKAFFADPDSRALMLEMFSDLPDVIRQWLGRIALLYGVPFHQLVIDERMLPQESIRFFFVDHNWLDAMIDGVFSIGVHSSRNSALVQVLVKAIREVTDTQMMLERSRLRKVAPPETVKLGGTKTGLLVRSAVVSGWPGLEVKAYETAGGSPPAGSNPLKLLRMDRLAPDVLFCLFDGVPARVEFNEPSEGLHFGIEDDNTITLRWINNDVGQAGAPIYVNGQLQTAQAVFRQDKGEPTGVLDVFNTQAALQSGLEKAGALAPSGQIGAAAFAIQMVQAPEQQAFEND
jgi:hypothetical protein